MVLWIFAQFFLCCEFGERLTAEYDEIDNKISDSKWYRFPHDIQKLLPTLFIGTQQPVVLSGFGNFEWTRDSFKSVRVFLYFVNIGNDVISY